MLYSHHNMKQTTICLPLPLPAGSCPSLPAGPHGTASAGGGESYRPSPPSLLHSAQVCLHHTARYRVLIIIHNTLYLIIILSPHYHIISSLSYYLILSPHYHIITSLSYYHLIIIYSSLSGGLHYLHIEKPNLGEGLDVLMNQSNYVCTHWPCGLYTDSIGCEQFKLWMSLCDRVRSW